LRRLRTLITIPVSPLPSRSIVVGSGTGAGPAVKLIVAEYGLLILPPPLIVVWICAAVCPASCVVNVPLHGVVVAEASRAIPAAFKVMAVPVPMLVSIN